MRFPNPNSYWFPNPKVIPEPKFRFIKWLHVFYNWNCECASKQRYVYRWRHSLFSHSESPTFSCPLMWVDFKKEQFCVFSVSQCNTLPRTATYCNNRSKDQFYVKAYPPSMPCNTLQEAATHCNTLQHTATHGNTLQHTVQRSVPGQGRSLGPVSSWIFIILQHTATYCNTRQHTATHGNILQNTATHCNTVATISSQWGQISQPSMQSDLHHTATHGNILPNTATHCNTLATISSKWGQIFQPSMQSDLLRCHASMPPSPRAPLPFPVAVRCSKLQCVQCVAVCWCVLQCVLQYL